MKMVMKSINVSKVVNKIKNYIRKRGYFFDYIKKDANDIDSLALIVGGRKMLKGSYVVGDHISGIQNDRLRYELEVYSNPLSLIEGSRFSKLKKLVLIPFLPFIRYQIVFNKKLLELLDNR